MGKARRHAVLLIILTLVLILIVYFFFERRLKTIEKKFNPVTTFDKKQLPDKESLNIKQLNAINK